MTQRFEQLYKLPDNLYINNSPIIISAGSLLKDSQTGSIIVQLKFHSISENTIKAVKISLSTFDVSGTELQGVKDYQYLDLSICNGQEFGSNKAIVLPSAVTRSFVISDITVVFSNDNQWKYNNSVEMASLPTLKHLSAELHNAEIEKQYKIATTPSATYIPSEMMSIWSCTCGEWNASARCTKCGSTKQMIFSALDIDELKINAEMRIASEKAQQEEQERLEEEERQESEKKLVIQKEHRKTILKKTKRILAVVLPVIILVLVFSAWIYPYIIKPNITYKEANRLFSEGQYSDAAKVFKSLGNYKDSLQLSELCTEQLALQEKDVLSLFQIIDYKISLQSLCDIMGSENYESSNKSFRNGVTYRSFSFSDNYTLNGLPSEVSFRFECKYNDALTVENDGELIAMTWSCPDELADIEMYQNLKQYIISILGTPTEESIAENNYGETYAYYTYWDDMQLSYSSTLGDNVYFGKNIGWVKG